MTYAFNLAWKLALVLGGTAGASLLDSYEQERLPIGRLAVEQTLQRHAYRAGAAERTFIDDAALMFGYRYHGGAIVPEPGTADAPLTQPPGTLCGEPGTRAPQLMLERDGARISTVDLCGGRWTLLTGVQGTAWAEAAQSVARRLALALSVQLIGRTPGWVDVAGRWNAAYGVGATGAVLVRPDGFVAWRSSGRVTDPQALLAQALDRVLGKA
jgi:hypothetical protein